MEVISQSGPVMGLDTPPPPCHTYINRSQAMNAYTYVIRKKRHRKTTNITVLAADPDEARIAFECKRPQGANLLQVIER